MQKFNKELLPNAFGIENFSNRCFFNSLLQGLFSCSSFINKINSIDSTDINKKTPDVMKLLQNILYEEDTNKYVIELHKLVARHIFETTKDRYRALSFLTGQQCCAEAYTLLMDLLDVDREISKLFTHRKEYVNYCNACDSEWSKTTENSNVFILENNLPIFEQILNNREKLDNDCKCSKCNAVGTTTRIMKLKLVPNILVIVSKKYNALSSTPASTIQLKEAPIHFTITGKKKLLPYRLVAQIFHDGDLRGGHYWTQCIRNDGWFILNDEYIIRAELKLNTPAYIYIYHYTEEGELL